MKKIVIVIIVCSIIAICLKLLPSNELNLYSKIGKDTITIFADGKYRLEKSSNCDILTMESEADADLDFTLLSFVKKIIKIDNKMYAYSDEGFAVINKDTKKCKLFILVEKQRAGDVPKNDIYVEYLSNFEEFDSEEQKILKQLENNGNKK